MEFGHGGGGVWGGEQGEKEPRITARIPALGPGWLAALLAEKAG